MLKPCMHNNLREAGCDEAGRGCLAGPVFAAAVILPPDFHHKGLNDSKKLTPGSREELRRIIETESVSFGIASADPGEIDSLNILRASVLAMHRAIDRLGETPEHLLIDGNWFSPYPGIRHTAVVRGDSIYQAIAAASILAKTYRDDYMREIHGDYPQYGWDSNKGYPTVRHRESIAAYGLTPHHRLSFILVPLQAPLDFRNAKNPVPRRQSAQD